MVVRHCLVAMSKERLKELCGALENEFGGTAAQTGSKAKSLRGDLPSARSSTRRLRCVMISKRGAEMLEATNLEMLCSKLVGDSEMMKTCG